MMGTSANTPAAETQLPRRHHLADCDATNAATENMTLDAQWKIVRKSGSSKDKKQHAVGCEYSRIEVDDRQLMI